MNIGRPKINQKSIIRRWSSTLPILQYWNRKNVKEALIDKHWIVAMLEELQ
jgi:hypothetical protein